MNPQGYPGSPEAPASGFPAAPPPPPPPPAPGQVPALRISTAAELGPRRPQLNAGGQDPYEPPAAIQNAMMTKDKKPFTYTPGMGGKLDLSQIRSPRMARRVAKNANDEGIEGPPKSSLAQEPRSPGTPNPQMYSCPQVAVPVFPQGQQPAVNLRNSTLPRSPPVIERVQAEPPAPRPVVKVETKLQPVANSPDTPTPPTSPTQVTLAKAPTPWMQKQVKQQEELPEWAKRSSVNRQDSSSSGSDSPQQQQPPQLPRQIVVVSSPRQPPQQQQQPQYQQPQYQQQMRPVRQESERPVPVRIEDRPSVFAAMNEPGHHQLMNTTPHHQSRWGNPVGMSAAPPPHQNQGGAYIVPIQVDGQQQYQNTISSPTNSNHSPMPYQPNRNVQRVQVQPAYNQQPEPGPVQSKSFKVLQKITDTDADQPDGEQLRKLQLTEDDRFLMNKFKEQVDGDGTYLHKEEDPRYRGAAIPSRAFRYLQNMTDSGDGSNVNSTPRPVNSAVRKQQNRNSNSFDEVPIPVQHIPASQQQVQEPKKYMGGAIPSRSFRILQAMTAPESIAITQVTQENRQDSAADYFSMPGNQQGVYYPVYPHPHPHLNSTRTPTPIPATPPPAYWNPEIGWWSYYPMQPSPAYPPPFDPFHNPYYYYQPQYYNVDNSVFVHPDNYPPMTQFSLDHSSRTSEMSDDHTSHSDECSNGFRGNPLSRNSALYAGSQWTCDSQTTTPTSCTTSNTTEQSSDRLVEERPLTSSSVMTTTSSLSSEDDSECDEEEEEEIEAEDSCCSSKGNDDEEEENASAESSDSSCDSDSYLAYSTGHNPMNPQKDETTRQDVEEKEVETENDSTDCEKESLAEDDQDVEKDDDIDGGGDDDDEDDNKAKIEDDADEKTSQAVDQEDMNTTVSVSLPLRFKFSVSDKNEDVTTVIVGDSTITRDVDTCVAFTLKRPSSQENCEDETVQETIQVKPTLVVTSTDEDRLTEPKLQETMTTTTNTNPTSIEDKRKTLLSVQSHSREEVTDDDDSGVTSDMSRIISEVDTDSECCLPLTTTTTPTDDVNPPVIKRAGQNKYQRTQTHSRLFRLLSDEQMRLPAKGSRLSNYEEHSSNSSGLTSPDCTSIDQPVSHHNLLKTRQQLPTRPKSLDCEALFRRHQEQPQQDSYYQTWKNGERVSPRKSPVTTPQWAYHPRVNVLCPRIKSAKNVPQTLSYQKNNQQPCMKSPLGSTMLSSSIPSPVRTNQRC